MEEIKSAVKAAAKDLFNVDMEPELSRPDEQFGDYATNVALQLAAKLGTSPADIATKLADRVKGLSSHITEAKVEGPGFINLHLSDDFLLNQAFEQKIEQPYDGQEILVEFGDPNPFKAMHIGHLYSYVIGDAISSLLESAGASVKRLSYHGDVGLHVARAIWAMQKDGSGNSNIGQYYAQGAKAYAEDEQAKQEIDEINKRIYEKDTSLQHLYDDGKTSSFKEFDEILQSLGIKTDKRYLESQSADFGLNLVKQNIGKVFQESQGAVIFEGEKVGLHTRVFITGKGLPTYETKDLGLTELKKQDFPDAKKSIIITANEQAEYFKVMLAALHELDPELADITEHRTHGFVSLSTGKMSSRTGDIYSAEELMSDVKQASEQSQKNTTAEIEIGAIKYAFAKHRLGGDIVYDVNESISLEGNSGPYLQYAHARARSILSKAEASDVSITDLNPDEKSLVRKLGEYPEVINKAVAELMPHHVCTYLYELAQVFNRFYENNRVIDDPRQAERLKIVSKYADTLKHGLELLNIQAPDKM